MKKVVLKQDKPDVVLPQNCGENKFYAVRNSTTLGIIARRTYDRGPFVVHCVTSMTKGNKITFQKYHSLESFIRNVIGFGYSVFEFDTAAGMFAYLSGPDSAKNLRKVVLTEPEEDTITVDECTPKLYYGVEDRLGHKGFVIREEYLNGEYRLHALQAMTAGNKFVVAQNPDFTKFLSDILDHHGERYTIYQFDTAKELFAYLQS